MRFSCGGGRGGGAGLAVQLQGGLGLRVQGFKGLEARARGGAYQGLQGCTGLEASPGEGPIRDCKGVQVLRPGPGEGPIRDCKGVQVLRPGPGEGPIRDCKGVQVLASWVWMQGLQGCAGLGLLGVDAPGVGRSRGAVLHVWQLPRPTYPTRPCERAPHSTAPSPPRQHWNPGGAALESRRDTRRGVVVCTHGLDSCQGLVCGPPPCRAQHTPAWWGLDRMPDPRLTQSGMLVSP